MRLVTGCLPGVAAFPSGWSGSIEDNLISINLSCFGEFGYGGLDIGGPPPVASAS